MDAYSMIQTQLGDLWEDFDRMFGDVHTTGGLTKLDQEMVLLGAYASRGETGPAKKHGMAAMEMGASPDAVVEVLLTATLSRGPRAIASTRELLSGLPLSSSLNYEALEGDILDFFATEYGAIPEWVSHLNELSPEYLASYARLRKRIQHGGIVSSKVKELLTMLLNTFDGSQEGTRIHAQNAVDHGASWREVEDTLLLGVLVGGIVVWIIGSSAIYPRVHG
jgi:alkylhydroperoxidase/carboxymuconolactone decarboxylase family protein YurZ